MLQAADKLTKKCFILQVDTALAYDKRYLRRPLIPTMFGFSFSLFNNQNQLAL